MATSRLDILINAKNNTAGALQQAQSMLGGIEKAAGLVAGGFAAAFGAQQVGQIAQTTFELGRASAESERLAQSFGTLATQAGQNANKMLAAMREAADGTINDSELMLSANRAMLLGVANTADEMAQLLEVASARGKAMGLSTAEAFSDIVTGIGRMSPMILDNLGIVVDAAAANEAYARSIGKAADKLTDNEQKQALLNAVLKESADLVRENNAAGADAASQFERMDAAIQNAKGALGKLFEPAMVVVAQAIADAAQAAADTMNSLTDEAAQTRQEMTTLDQAAVILRNDLAQLERGMRQLRDAGQENTQAFRDAEAQYEAVRTRLLEVEVAQRANIDATDGAASSMDTFTLAATQAAIAAAEVGNAADDASPKIANMGLEARLAAEEFDYLMSRTQSNLRSLQGIASQMVDNLGMSGAQDWLNEQNALLRMQQQYWEDTLGYSRDYIDNVLTPAYLSTLRSQAAELDKAEKSTRKIRQTVPKISEEFRNLQSTVQAALSGALDPGVGVNPDKLLEELFGFREDAINENARRLADIAANGLKDQDWLGEFAKEAPDIWQAIRMASNPQEEAAFLLRDFQAGLRPDLIDKGRAKELVRRMLRGEANMAELAREISEELAAEMGIPLQEALSKSQAALGIGGSGAGAEIGEALGRGAVDAMTSGNKGAEAVDAFISNMRGVYNRLNTAGFDGGKQWATGFMEAVGENVPGPLINLLVNLVTPGVMAQIYQHGTLTGAES